LHRFPARLDSLSRTLSFVVVVALIIPFGSILTQYLKYHDPLLLIGPVIVVVALIVAALLRTTAYEINNAGILVIRPFRSVEIPFREIRSINSITSKELGFGLRAFGSGGFLGYFGRFYYRDHGWITLYATDRSKMLLITLHDDRKIIITPDDLEGFMKTFREMNL
jgi:hypothetical protein